MGSLCALGCRVIYNHKAGVSGRSLREVFKGGFYGYRAGPPLLLLVTAYVPIRRTVDEGPAGLKFTLHGGPVGGDGAQGEKTGLPGSASHTVSGGAGSVPGPGPPEDSLHEDRMGWRCMAGVVIRCLRPRS